MSSKSDKPRFSTNKKLLILGIIVASVISTPFVYGAVEPHIKITMDVSQTTKPLQIVDDQDVEVFSVDVDGTIFPSQTGFDTIVTNELQELSDAKAVIYYTNSSTITLTADGSGDFDTFLELATWRIDFNSPAVDDEDTNNSDYPFVYSVFDGVSGFIGSDSLPDNAELSLRQSFDQITWTYINQIDRDAGGSGVTGFSAQSNMDNNGGVVCDRTTEGEPAITSCYISLRFGGVSVNPPYEVRVKDITVYMELILPAQTTLTRVS